MSKTSQFFHYKKCHLHYSVFGTGEKVMLAFHGYGQTNHVLQQLEQSLSDYHVYAFDLFYHGESFWHCNDSALTKEFWAEIIAAFLKEKSIETFSLIGFSMGGKLVLATLERFPHKVQELILIAPDGVKRNIWYTIATLPGFNKLFRRVVVDPEFYFRLTNIVAKFKLVDQGVIRFAENQMKTRVQRRRVYFSWQIFRNLKFDLNYMCFLINQYQIPLTVFLGKYDKIVTLKDMNRLLKRVKKSEVHILETGHSNLISSVDIFYKKNNEK